MRACNTFIHVCIQYSEYSIDSTVYLCTHSSMFVHIHYGYIYIYYACLLTIKYYTVQVTNLYADASDSQDNHTEVYNIIRMQMTPKIITIRYIKRYKTLATLKFSHTE